MILLREIIFEKMTIASSSMGVKVYTDDEAYPKILSKICKVLLELYMHLFNRFFIT